MNNDFLSKKLALYKTMPSKLCPVLDQVIGVFAEFDLSKEEGLIVLEKVKEAASIIYGSENE